MPDAVVTETKQPTTIDSSNRVTRRNFLGLTGKAAAAVVAIRAGLFPAPAAAQTSELVQQDNLPQLAAPPYGAENHPQLVDKEFDWDNLRKMLNEAPVDSSSAGLKTIAGDWINQLEKSYDPRVRRTRHLIDLTRQPDQRGNPSLLVQQVEIFLGKIDRSLVNPEQVLPFFQERSNMLNNFNVVRDSIQRMSIKGDGSPTLQDQYYYLQQFISQTWRNHQKDFGSYNTEPDENKEVPVQPPIVMDPSITSTEEGKKIFEEHKRKIEQFIRTYKYFNGLSSKIVLASHAYGAWSTTNTNGGTYNAENDTATDRVIGKVWINMDSMFSPNADYWPEKVFAHEAFGHGLDPFFSKDLDGHLTPKDLIERYTHYFQILNNPDWTSYDGSVADLFRQSPNYLSSFRPLMGFDSFIKSGRKLTTSEFMTIISEYPRNYILFNGLPTINGSAPKGGGEISIFDTVLGLPPEPAPALVPQSPAALEVLGYDQFLGHFLPTLKEQANGLDTMAIKAQTILYGLGKFKDQLRNTDFLWHNYFNQQGDFAPTEGKATFGAWVNYLNTVVLNATLYDGFINGDPYFQGWSKEIREKFSRCIVELRKRSREEFFAEGVAWSHYLGERAPDEPANPQKRLPYRLYLEHTANLLLERLQRQKVTSDTVNTAFSNQP